MKLTSNWKFLSVALAALVCCAGRDSGSDDMRGRGPGTEFTRACPDDRVLVGFRGRNGALVDS